MLQPKMIPCALGFPSAFNLSRARNSSRGMGLSMARGRFRMWMASGTAAGVRKQFSGVSRKTVMTLLTKQSALPSGHAGGSRASGKAVPNGTLEWSRVGAGTKCCTGLWNMDGTQSLQSMRLLARLVAISDAVHQVGGQPDPPNDNGSSMYARLLCIAMHCDAPLPEYWICQYALEKSYLLINMISIGKWRRIDTMW